MLVIEYIAKFLKEYGIKQFFGYQGGAVSSLIKALVETQGMEYIQAYTEQGAAFYGEAAARISDKLSLIIATNGPGVTNLVSGIANAYLDSIPCLFITGQVNTTDIRQENIRQNGFQEIDTEKICAPITKYSKTIKNPNDICFELGKAIYIATNGRKGSVVLDIPLDVQNSEIDETKLKEYQFFEIKKEIKNQTVNDVFEMIMSAKRPLAIAGGGIRLSNSYALFLEFIENYQVPFVTTLMGLDLFSKYNVGFSGLYGNTYSNLAINNADLIIVLGSRLAKRQIGINNKSYIKNAKIIQVDIDENELTHTLNPDVKINCLLKQFFEAMVSRFKCNQSETKSDSEWIIKLQKWKEKYHNNTFVNKVGLDPVVFIKQISKKIAEDSIVTADVGQNQMWLAQGFELKSNQRILNSGGLGCMGFSLPAAIGAKISNPDKNVIAFMGDGGFQMNIQELQQIKNRGLSIKIFILNNNSLGMIQEVQEKFMNGAFHGTKIGYTAPNIKDIAYAYGIEYIRIDDKKDITSDILSNDKAYLIEVCIKNSPSKLLNKYDELDLYNYEMRV